MKGRGASANPKNRFEPLERVREDEPDEDGPGPRTELILETAKSILAENQSPDIGFEVGLNPYRGCEHGCSYCFARPYHEYLGYSTGVDFETKIVVKKNAPELLRKELASKAWEPRAVMLSGATDCYQPAERKLGLTRRCLQVLAEFRNPVGVITKNQLVTRDADVLAELARHRCAAVTVSITTLDPVLARSMEPRASTPAKRLEAIGTLAAAGVPVGVNVAPVIPGLTDHEMAPIVRAAKKAGATFGGCQPVRLPHAVKDVFERWLSERVSADRAKKVLSQIRQIRGGRLNDPGFGSRMTGEGPFAEQIRAMFKLAAAKAGFKKHPALSTAAFRRPAGPQLDLFGGDA